MSPAKSTPKRLLTVTNGLTVALAVVIGLNVWYFTSRSAPAHVLEGMRAPELHLPRVVDAAPSTATVALSDYRGKVVLVDFWALFCPPCLEELPVLDAMTRDLPEDDFALLAVNVDPAPASERAPRIDDLVQTEGYHLDMLLGDQRSLATYQVDHLPALILIDRDAHVRRVFIGRTPAKTIRHEIDVLIREGRRDS